MSTGVMRHEARDLDDPEIAQEHVDDILLGVVVRPRGLPSR
jgi:hypothetical protein